MNQTQDPGSSTGPALGPPPDPSQPGVDRDHLRDYRQLRRSLSDRKIAGVAGGLGRHLHVDPTVLRVMLVVLCFFGGAGFLLYGAAWLLVPEDGSDHAVVTTNPQARNTLLIGVGVLAALVLLGHGWGGFGVPWPVVIVGGVVALVLASRDSRRHPSTDRPTAPPVAAPGATASAPPTWSAPPQPGPAAAPTDAAPTDSAPYEAVGPSGAGAPPWTPTWAPPPPPPPPPAPRRVKRGPVLFGFTLALIALALAGLGLADATGAHVVASAYPALALGIVGVMLVVGSFLGRAGGLILLGILSILALSVTSVIGLVGGDLRLDGKQVTEHPTSAVSVQPAYQIKTGQLELDLSRVTDPAALAGRTVEVQARVGELVVTLPRGVSSRVVATIDGPGQIDLPGKRTGGFDTDAAGTYRNGGAAGAEPLTIDLHTKVGHIDVRNP